MIDKAIAKITEEAMKIDDPMAIAIEEYLTSKCTNVAVAKQLLDDSKTLKGAIKEVWDEARKRKKGNVAFIPPEEVYGMIDNYYGISNAGSKVPESRRADKVNVLDLF